MMDQLLHYLQEFLYCTALIWVFLGSTLAMLALYRIFDEKRKK